MNHTLPQEEPQPGDLIEMSRVGYQHWALYAGHGFIIHLTGTGSSNVATATFGSLGSATTTKAVVKKEKLRDAVGNDKWKINNTLDTKYKPRPLWTILQDAEALVGREVKYNLLSLNCEHFSNGLRYGKPESRQVQQAGETALFTGWTTAAVMIAGAGLALLLGGNRNQNQKK